MHQRQRLSDVNLCKTGTFQRPNMISGIKRFSDVGLTVNSRSLIEKFALQNSRIKDDIDIDRTSTDLIDTKIHLI